MKPVGIVSDGGVHLQGFKKTFNLMIHLRQLGFPSPILDWNRDFLTAVFFAIAHNPTGKNVAIYQVERSLSEPIFYDINKLKIFFSEFEFDTSINLRHLYQDSFYSLAVETTKEGPSFKLSNCNKLFEQRGGIKKYVITDSKVNRLAILEELNTTKSYKNIYGATPVLENTVLKYLAIKLFWL